MSGCRACNWWNGCPPLGLPGAGAIAHLCRSLKPLPLAGAATPQHFHARHTGAAAVKHGQGIQRLEQQ